ncbi:MAG: TIGR00289 family protein, partial [Candidatus Methanoperedens sp.]|nr:TIGR00289 family protein [Candidatus Methanoperedens sp.]
MKLAALVSGGKDSSFAIYRALQEGYEVTDLVTIVPADEDSYMFHSANIHLTRLISEACGIPLTSMAS